jgi:hypothetical protein
MGWNQVKTDSMQARVAASQRRRNRRLRVHKECVIDGDEQLGLSALDGATCDRCRKRIQDAAVMVQRFAHTGVRNEAG